jgi:hypothetical protein
MQRGSPSAAAAAASRGVGKVATGGHFQLPTSPPLGKPGTNADAAAGVRGLESAGKTKTNNRTKTRNGATNSANSATNSATNTTTSSTTNTTTNATTNTTTKKTKEKNKKKNKTKNTTDRAAANAAGNAASKTTIAADTTTSKTTANAAGKTAHVTSADALAFDAPASGTARIASSVADHARIAAGKARYKTDLVHATMPLGAVLHILRERRKDQLYLNCFWYFVFILLYTVVVNMHHHIFTSFSQNYGIRDVLLNEPFQEPDDLRTYHDVGEIDEWWLWFEGPFAQKIWSTEWYSGDTRDNETEMGLLLQECYVIGAVRLRQVRTVMELKTAGKRTFKSWPPYRTAKLSLFHGKPGAGGSANASTSTSCGLSSSAENPLFTGGGKDGDPARGAETRTDLRTQDGTASFGEYCTGLGALDGMSYDPLQTEHYGGAGYVIDFPRNNASHAMSTIAKLKAARWIDQGTRAVAVDLNVYNPSTDTVTALRVR